MGIGPRRMIGMALLAAALGLGLPPGGAPAQAQQAAGAGAQARFDLAIRGIRAGVLTFTAVEEGRSYAVNGKLESGGLAAFVRRVRYDAQARGTVQDGRYVPQSYSENADTGRRQSQSVMTYRRGVPQVSSITPPREPRAEDVDPATQGGTVDPLTALYATLRDVARGMECRVSLQMFDGRRRSALVLSSPQARDGGVTCAGEYRRVAGFSAEDMAEKTRFPFTLTYRPGANGRMQVTEVAMDSLYGRASLTRR